MSLQLVGGITTSATSPFDSFLASSVFTIACFPDISSNRTTPNAYTSILGETSPYCAYLHKNIATLGQNSLLFFFFFLTRLESTKTARKRRIVKTLWCLFISVFLTQGAYSQTSRQGAFVTKNYHIRSILSDQNLQPVNEKLDSSELNFLW